MPKDYRVQSGDLDVEVTAESPLEAAMMALHSVPSAHLGALISIDTSGEQTGYVQTGHLLRQLKRNHGFSYRLEPPRGAAVSALRFNRRWETRLAVIVVGLALWGHLLQTYPIAVNTALYSREGVGYTLGVLCALVSLHFLTAGTVDAIIRSSFAYVAWFLAGLAFVVFT